MIAIIVALNSEANPFIEKIKNKKQSFISGKKVITGKVLDKEVVLCVCGIGKVNAALATQMLIDKFNPDYVFNFGSAGGTNASVKVREYYLIDGCAQYDFDLNYLDGVPVGYIQDYDTVIFPTFTQGLDFLPKGRVSSGDRFNDEQKDIDTINQMTCNVRDMEGGAIGQVCLANDKKLIMIKGISDVYGLQKSNEQFFQNLTAVCEGFYDVIVKIFRALSI